MSEGATASQACPLCGGTDSMFVERCTENLRGREQYSIHQCGRCRFMFTVDAPLDRLAGYYVDDRYLPLARFSPLRRCVRWLRGMRRYFLIVRAARRWRGDLCDIGCATGDFLLLMKRRGWRVRGIELDGGGAAACVRKGLDVRQGADLSVFGARQFDVVTLWHVLEHVPDIHGTMEHIARILRPDGVCVIAVPNVDSPVRDWYGRHWSAYDVPRHLSHFSPRTVSLLAEEHGLTVASIVPTPLDAFDMCLRSEKLTGGSRSRGILRALQAVTRSIASPVRSCTLTAVLRPNCKTT